ncbi:MAG: PRC-barrel domain-containing protein [Acidobacteria bacterium]|nr:PRC-barrel domain-containing protein [Acidobacteriota bacterium]
MASIGNISSIDTLIGRAVLSRASANKLGQVHDLIIEPVNGSLAGVAVNMADGKLHYAEASEIYSIGPDAIMVNSDRSAIPSEGSPVKGSPLAMNKLVGVEVMTEGGKVLGQVANIFMHLAEEPVLIYEVRSSILDKLLGRSLFFPASQGHAYSAADTRLVVKDDTEEKADSTLDVLANRMFGPPKEDNPVVVIRSRGY